MFFGEGGLRPTVAEHDCDEDGRSIMLYMDGIIELRP